LLKGISDPPLVLYVKGNLDCLYAKRTVAVIGTREPTEYGREVAESFGRLIGARGITVVSGLAKGCDSAAHRGCLAAGGKTVAVLPSGINKIYPQENTGLAQAIIEGEGCLLSEYPPDEKAEANYFIARDRLQSGLSDLVVVIEAEITGGTMHTVNFAIKYGKRLACLDHPEALITTKAAGNKMLIREGKAMAIKDINDLVRILNTML